MSSIVNEFGDLNLELVRIIFTIRLLLIIAFLTVIHSIQEMM